MPTKGPPTVGEILATLNAVAAERDRLRVFNKELVEVLRQSRKYVASAADDPTPNPANNILSLLDVALIKAGFVAVPS